MNAKPARKPVPIPNPSAPTTTPDKFAGRQPKAAAAEDTKRLTVDIPTEVHRALAYAKTDEGKEMRALVTEALRAHPAIARHLKTD